MPGPRTVDGVGARPEDGLGTVGGGGRGVIEDKHSTPHAPPPPPPRVCMNIDLELATPPPPSRVRMRIRPAGKSCSDKGPDACSHWPCWQAMSKLRALTGVVPSAEAVKECSCDSGELKWVVGTQG